MNRLSARTRRGAIAILAALLLVVSAPLPAWADSNDDVLAVYDTLAGEMDAFGRVYSDQSTSEEAVIAAAQKFQKAAAAAQTDYQRIADDTDNGDAAKYAGEFATESGDIAAASGHIADAFTGRDSTALGSAESDLNAALTAYQHTADDYAAFLKTTGDPSYVAWLIVLIVAVVYFAVTLLFAALTRRQSGLLPATVDKKGRLQQSSLKRLRWMVVLWAAVFVAGAAIPFFQVVFAQPDASGNYTYRIAWYPLAGGAILSVVGVVRYLRAAATVRREGSAAAITTATAVPPVAEPAPAHQESSAESALPEHQDNRAQPTAEHPEDTEPPR